MTDVTDGAIVRDSQDERPLTALARKRWECLPHRQENLLVQVLPATRIAFIAKCQTA